MADNVNITEGSGKVVAADDISSVLYQRVKLSLGADGSAVDAIAGAGAVSTAVQRVTLASDDPAVTSLALLDDVIFADDTAYTPATSKALVIGAQADMTAPDSVDEGDAGALRMTLSRELLVSPLGFQVTCATDITRPSDTNAYAANDVWSDSTSAPTAGGFTLTGAARKSGGSGIITDAIITTSADAGTLLQGEIWVFDTAVTAVNDNAAFAVSDSEIKTYVCKIAFTLEDAGNNGAAHVAGLNYGFTTVGSANLRYLVKVKNAYTPASAEVLTVRLKIVQTD
jgi:hypothetical protein